MTKTTMQIVSDDVSLALQAVEQSLPSILAAVSAVDPAAGALLKFVPLIERALQGVDTVQKGANLDAQAATVAVINTLTPGCPNSPVLTASSSAT